jgi:hypothetical protein
MSNEELYHSSKIKPPSQSENTHQHTLQELVSMLKEMSESVERLPTNAMTSFVTHYDMYSFLLLVVAFATKVTERIDGCSLDT